ncbi:MAG: M28 family peptidase [Planctomycetota bacterium]|nr:MAG: M28 family peptidase [Planctomycetota bacterium]
MLPPASETAPARDVRPAVAARPELAQALLDRGLGERRAYGMLVELLEVAPKRLAGSPGYEAAARWAERTMQDIGLANVRMEPVMAPHWERGDPERASARLADGSALELSACALGGSPAGSVTAPAVELNGLAALAELEAAGGSLQGRIVFLNQRMNPAARSSFQAYGGAAGQRTRGPALAAKLGAVGVVIRSLSSADDDVPHTGMTRFEDAGPKIPALALGVQSAERLSAALAAGKVESVTLETHCRELADREQWNVVGEIAGSKWPEEVVVLGAHLDAWETGDGAHDDGAGCTHVLEAARLLLACGVAPLRTVRVVLFANEENGLAGGRGYAEAHAGEAHFVLIESDSGGGTPRGLGLSVDEHVLERLRPAGAPLAAIAAERVSGGGGGADIGPMAERAGAPEGSLSVDDTRYFDLHHSANDVLESVHPRQLELGAVVLAYWAAVLADLGPGELSYN